MIAAARQGAGVNPMKRFPRIAIFIANRKSSYKGGRIKAIWENSSLLL